MKRERKLPGLPRMPDEIVTAANCILAAMQASMAIKAEKLDGLEKFIAAALASLALFESVAWPAGEPPTFTAMKESMADAINDARAAKYSVQKLTGSVQ